MVYPKLAITLSPLWYYTRRNLPLLVAVHTGRPSAVNPGGGHVSCIAAEAAAARLIAYLPSLSALGFSLGLKCIYSTNSLCSALTVTLLSEDRQA